MTETSEIAILSQSLLSVDKPRQRLRAVQRTVYGTATAVIMVVIVAGTFAAVKWQEQDTRHFDNEGDHEDKDDTESYATPLVVRSGARSLVNDSNPDSLMSRTPFVCTVGLSLHFLNHSGLVSEDGLCDYLIFQSTFVQAADGTIDLWDGRNRTRAFRTFLAFAMVARKTGYGVAVTHRRVEDAQRQLDTLEGRREFLRYWDSGVRHHAVLDFNERRIRGPRDVSNVFALLRAFKLLQLEHTESDALNTAYIFLGCSITRPENNLLYDVLGAELSDFPVDVFIMTTHMMASEQTEKAVVPPTTLRKLDGVYLPAILNMAHHASETEHLNTPTAIALTLDASALAFEVPKRTRIGAVCDKGPIAVPIKEVCAKSNYPQDVTYGNATIVSRFYSPTKGRLYLFDSKETFRFKMCTLRRTFPQLVHGWVIFNVDMADYDHSCNGTTRGFDRVHTIRDTFEEYLQLATGQGPMNPC